MSKWGNCDFEQIKRLEKNLEKLQDSIARDFYEAAAQELAARLLAMVIKRTPVGVKPKFKDDAGKELPLKIKVKGKSGKSRTFLTKEGAVLSRYWSGYVGGTLRRGWTAKTEQEAESGGSVSPQEYANRLPVTKNGSEYRITVVNPVHYASYVEYGHRQTPGRYVPALGKRLKNVWVPGQHMLTISEQEIQTKAPAILERKIAQFMQRCFHAQ